MVFSPPWVFSAHCYISSECLILLHPPEELTFILQNPTQVLSFLGGTFGHPQQSLLLLWKTGNKLLDSAQYAYFTQLFSQLSAAPGPGCRGKNTNVKDASTFSSHVYLTSAYFPSPFFSHAGLFPRFMCHLTSNGVWPWGHWQEIGRDGGGAAKLFLPLPCFNCCSGSCCAFSTPLAPARQTHCVSNSFLGNAPA